MDVEVTKGPTPQGNRRKTGDERFYTPSDTAATIVRRVLDQWPDARNGPWLEPAGGTGSFVSALRELGIDDVTSLDTLPLHGDIQHGDFLRSTFTRVDHTTVSNPPFGRNHALSIPFFNHAANYSNMICFIVPKSWRKWSVLNRLDRRFHLVDDYDLQINYVDRDGRLLSNRGTLRTIVQTYQRGDRYRSIIQVLDRGVVSRCTCREADVALTIFGFACGRIETEFARLPNTTKMYLKLQHPRALEALHSVDFSRFFNNTAFTEALSMQEINYLLNDFIFGDPGLVDGDVTLI